MLRFLLFATFGALVLGDTVVPYKNVTNVKPQGKVIGGYVSAPNAWPWQASLRTQSGICYVHVCGGVLIRKQWVLTTAQCVDGIQISTVVLGDHDLTSAEMGKEQYYGVSSVYIHPGWNRDLTAGNDIALIRLTSEAILNAYVKLAPLPSTGQILPGNTNCYVTGWGVTQTGGFLSAQLKYAQLLTVDYATCSTSNWWGSKVKSTMICAGGGTNSACNGDAGGPLNCMVGASYVVHGLTSFVSAAGCNTIGKPTVFTRVSAYTPWVIGVSTRQQ
ncbi:elastase-1-like [Hoplias malabaricus]|uniref:elastase-1-like n=1 Tax=Hoplias malabaricus TaxID=27720 RepID=UPI003462B781